MFACHGVVLLGLHLFRMQSLVLARGIEVTGTGAGVRSAFHEIRGPFAKAAGTATRVAR